MTHEGRAGDGLTIGTIIREPLAVVQEFVTFHLAQGADRIALCFDDPADPAAEAFAAHPQVDVHRCDEPFWRALGASPDDRFTRRQCHALTFLYRRVTSGWFAGIDGDERFHAPNGDLSSRLSRLPAEVDYVRVQTAEKITFPHDDALHFRLPMRNWVLNALYDDLADALRGRHGLVGHIAGKSFVRAGLDDISLRQHWPVPWNGRSLTEHRWSGVDGVYLLHLIDEGFAVWRDKLQWRLSSANFSAQMRGHITRAMQANDAEMELRRIYNALFVFGEDRLELLRRAGRHLSVPRRQVSTSAEMARVDAA